jgi:hypothetical protein
MELARQRTMADKVVANAATAARAKQATVKKVVAEEATTSRAAADEAAVEEAVMARALSSETGPGELHEAIEEASGEALAGAGTRGSEEVAVQASSDAVPTPGTRTDMPTLEERAGEVTEVTDLTRTGADIGPRELLKNPLKLELGRLAIARPPLLLRLPPKALREEELL